jgi:hypothetical protein
MGFKLFLGILTEHYRFFWELFGKLAERKTPPEEGYFVYFIFG